VLDGLRSANLLVLDAGNALFRNAGAATPDDLARARLLLSVMGRLGTRAMAVGARDLSGGPAFLAAQAKAANVKPLSANLTRDGRRVFEAAALVDVGGLKVGLVGVSAPGPIVTGQPAYQAGPTLPAVKAALGSLGPRALTVLLAATSAADAQQLAAQLQGQVDLVLQSGEFRGTVPPARVGESDVFVLASGQKGQALGKLELTLGGRGPLVDLSVRQRDAQQLLFVQQQRARLEERLAAATAPQQRQDLETTLASLRQREAQLAAVPPLAPGARTLKLDWVLLGQDVADDEAVKAEVLRVEPTYQGQH
jgi:2',3'-cyclic-nucleotide 2'-phosphodiesterase (5'-nucleotidase family)